jgi:hypothetical protein
MNPLQVVGFLPWIASTFAMGVTNVGEIPVGPFPDSGEVKIIQIKFLHLVG